MPAVPGTMLSMEKARVVKKFGKEFSVDDDTFTMGIHYALSDRIARRFATFNSVLDACCGAGFMSLALVNYVKAVTAVDVDENHLQQAQYNAAIANAPHIAFVLGDIMKKETWSSIPAIDCAFLDPDWAPEGKQKHIHVSKFSAMKPAASALFSFIFEKTPNIVLRLPKEIDRKELAAFPPHELESVYLDGELKFYCAYFGALRTRPETCLAVFSNT